MFSSILDRWPVEKEIFTIFLDMDNCWYLGGDGRDWTTWGLMNDLGDRTLDYLSRLLVNPEGLKQMLKMKEEGKFCVGG